MPVSQLTPENQPALFLVEVGEKYVQEHLQIPPVVYLTAQLYICQFFSSAFTDVPATIVNNLLDALEDALIPDPGVGVLTLGNLVQRAWISGRVTDSFPSTQGQQAISIVELSLLVNH